MASVTVVIPTYNAAAHVAETVQTIQRQTAPIAKIIVVDDASTDETVARVSALARTEPRIEVVTLRINGGPSRARNVGIDRSETPWVAVADADDAMAPDRIAGLLELAHAHEADMVADNVGIAPIQGGEPYQRLLSGRQWAAPQQLDLGRYLRGCYPDHRGRGLGLFKPMFSRAFLERHRLRYREDLRFAEDFEFVARCLLAGARFYVRPEATYTYTRPSVGNGFDIRKAELVLRTNRELAALPAARAASRWRRAFARRGRYLERTVRYQALVEQLRRCSPRGVVASLLTTPWATPYWALRLGAAGGNRAKAAALRAARRVLG